MQHIVEHGFRHRESDSVKESVEKKKSGVEEKEERKYNGDVGKLLQVLIRY